MSNEYPVLFLANQCTHSQRLMHHHASELSKCPRIVVYDRKDKNIKRKQEAMYYIRQYNVLQFPTLIFADGSRLTTARGIQADLTESIQVLAEQPLIPRLQDKASQHHQISGNAYQQHHTEDGRINLSDPTIQTSAFGDWPTLEQPQQQQNGNSSSMYHHSPQEQQLLQEEPDQPRQISGSTNDGRQHRLAPLSYNPQDRWTKSKHGSEAIGTSSDVDTSAAGAGSTTMMGSTDAPMHDEEQENLGQWPTSRKVQGLTGNGNKTMDTHRFLSDRANKNQSMQGAQMQLGQNVADPVPCFK